MKLIFHTESNHCLFYFQECARLWFHRLCFKSRRLRPPSACHCCTRRWAQLASLPAPATPCSTPRRRARFTGWYRGSETRTLQTERLLSLLPPQKAMQVGPALFKYAQSESRLNLKSLTNSSPISATAMLICLLDLNFFWKEFT